MEIDLLRLLWALGLMVLAIGCSVWQRLGLGWNLAIATLRTSLQLLMMGYFLAIVFVWRHPWAVLVALLVMLTMVTVVTRNGISKKIPRLWLLIGGSFLAATGLTLAYTILLILQPQHWYEPQYLIPLAGILFGNAMNGAAIAGERLATTISQYRLEIETHLSLGATPQQAIVQYHRDAIKAGFIPTLNTMMVAGMVTLPGVFSGQLLGGVDPLNAALDQILIMFMLAFSTLLTLLLVTQGLCRSFFNQAAQLIIY
ncbi:MAG: iron export ABC transporter permease subunit FetB [Cyanothece sp. SIO1E1]|nr:iron export ABC transporter permease subunit FetB [Cyanothece sp. SIO1E1]